MGLIVDLLILLSVNITLLVSVRIATIAGLLEKISRISNTHNLIDNHMIYQLYVFILLLNLFLLAILLTRLPYRVATMLKREYEMTDPAERPLLQV